MRTVALIIVTAFLGCERPCTLRGCIDTIRFEFSEATRAELVNGATARVCVDDTCIDHVINATAEETTLSVFQGEPASGTGDVTLTITRDGTERLTRTWNAVVFTAFDANGEGCGPICHTAGPLLVE